MIVFPEALLFFLRKFMRNKVFPEKLLYKSQFSLGISKLKTVFPKQHRSPEDLLHRLHFPKQFTQDAEFPRTFLHGAYFCQKNPTLKTYLLRNFKICILMNIYICENGNYSLGKGANKQNGNLRWIFP